MCLTSQAQLKREFLRVRRANTTKELLRELQTSTRETEYNTFRPETMYFIDLVII